MAAPEVWQTSRRAAPEGAVAGDVADPLRFDAGRVIVRRIEPLAVIALRHLPGAGDALACALQAAGVPGVPEPGQVLGQGPWALWRSPSEVTLLATERAAADAAMAALAFATLACAVDQSEGTLGLELQGPHVDELLRRLVDSRSLPSAPGRAVRARLVDIAVVLVRQQPDNAWLLADRSHGHYLSSWLGYAGEALATTLPPAR
ncbi:MAG: Sarcosine oxidase, gamma subunit family [Pseudomonadota bacterium]